MMRRITSARRATVCGSVVSTHYAPGTKGQPTFLNLDKPYPNQVFTVLIWGESRSKFGTPESEYKGRGDVETMGFAFGRRPRQM
jgi:hypothetical protein